MWYVWYSPAEQDETLHIVFLVIHLSPLPRRGHIYGDNPSTKIDHLDGASRFHPMVIEQHLVDAKRQCKGDARGEG